MPVRLKDHIDGCGSIIIVVVLPIHSFRCNQVSTACQYLVILTEVSHCAILLLLVIYDVVSLIHHQKLRVGLILPFFRRELVLDEKGSDRFDLLSDWWQLIGVVEIIINADADILMMVMIAQLFP